jgi:Fe-S cluster biogenesis protein NfuA
MGSRKTMKDKVIPGNLENGAAIYTRQEQMRGLIDQLSAYIEHYHGGSVELVEFDGRILKVRLGGACLGCPLSVNTLHGWVEGTVRQFFPDIEEVQSVS